MKQLMWEYVSGKTALYVGVCILFTQQMFGFHCSLYVKNLLQHALCESLEQKACMDVVPIILLSAVHSKIALPPALQEHEILRGKEEGGGKGKLKVLRVGKDQILAWNTK